MIPAWLAAIRARCAAATKGPWVVWDGPAYEGGGRDLCIGGPGDAWLANMDHRRCVREREHYDHYIAQSCAHEPVSDVCRIDSEITAEQEANAALIAHARADLPALLALAEGLAEALDRIACWSEGAEVASSFDEPHAARIARDALARWAAGPGATTGKERTT